MAGRLGLCAALTAGLALAACGKGPPDPEMEAQAAWLKTFKAEHPDEGHVYATECIDEHGFGIAREKVKALVNCVRSKAEADGLA